MTSPASYSTAVQELYVAYFGRPADYYGLQNFAAALANANAPTDLVHLAQAYNTNAAVKALVDSFGTSTESHNLYGTLTGNASNATTFVNSVFQNLFGRAANQAGLDFWGNAIKSGALSPSDAALAIAAGAIANTSAQGKVDAATLTNKVSAATDFTVDVGASTETIVAYYGAFAGDMGRSLLGEVSAGTDLASFASQIASTVRSLTGPVIVGPVYSLTMGADHIVTQGISTVEAVLDNAAGLAAGGQAATLNPGDTVVTDGAAGTVTIMNLTDFGIGGDLTLPGQVTLSGINKLVINSLEAMANQSAPGGSIDFTTWAGLNQLSINASTGADNVTVSSTTAVSVKDTAGDVTVHGGASIAVTTDAASIITVHGGADTTSVSLSGGGSDARFGNSITDLNFGTGHVNTISSVSLTGDGSTTIFSDALTSLSISGASDTVAVDAAAGARTLSVTNDAASVALTDNSATALDITTTGSGNHALIVDAGSAKSITFNVQSDLSLTYFVAPRAESVIITGPGALSLAFHDTGETPIATAPSVDASGSTGALNLTFDTGTTDKLIGGSGDTTVVNSGLDVLDIALGSGSNIIVNGPGDSGTISIAAHTAANYVAPGTPALIGVAPDLTHIVAISGLNNAGQDSIRFEDGFQYTDTSFQQVSAAQVAKAGATTTSLNGWIAAATGQGGVVAQSAHGVLEFQFDGNTYLIETAAANDAGTFGATDTIVELTGSGYTFAHVSTINNGLLHLTG